MQVAQAMAGYSMVEADQLRKAMGKKIKSVMEAEREKFVAGSIEQGHPESVGSELFGLIAHFAGYGFTRAHAACYGYVAYQTAYLKAHHPAEYLAALLTATKKDKDRTALYLNECRAMDTEVLVPDVNESDMDFTVADGRIRFGLSAIRNVGEGVVEKIVAAREEGGPFQSFQDFADRVDPLALNKRTVESFIKAGAFDAFGDTRKGLFLASESVLDATLERRRNEDMGQFSLFGEEETERLEVGPVPIGGDEWSQKVRLAFEKEMLGRYISDHPLLRARNSMRNATTASIAELADMSDRASVTVGGLVSSITRKWTKNGDPIIFFELEDLDGSVEVLMFKNTVAEYGTNVTEDNVVVVSGRLDHRGDLVKIRSNSVEELDVREDETVRLQVPASRLSPETVSRLKAILANHPGSTSVHLHLTNGSGHKILKLSDDHRVEPRSALFAELKELLGQKAVV